MFDELVNIFEKPAEFEYANSTELWNNSHIAEQMLKLHLDPDEDLASRNKEFMDRSLEWIIDKFNITSSSKVLDLGCGPGLYTSEFAKTGAKVTGIDVSKNSIEYARQQAEADNLDINYINDNYLNFDFAGKYNLITLIYCDYCVLNPDQRKILLNKIYSSLDVNGSFILDVLSVNYFAAEKEKQICTYVKAGGFWSPLPHFVFENIFKYEQGQIVLQKNTVIEKKKYFTIYNYLRCFTLDEIIAELAANGFETVEYFSDIAGSKYDKNSTEITLVNIKG